MGKFTGWTTASLGRVFGMRTPCGLHNVQRFGGYGKALSTSDAATRPTRDHKHRISQSIAELDLHTKLYPFSACMCVILIRKWRSSAARKEGLYMIIR